jgi:hypothetical protein
MLVPDLLHKFKLGVWKVTFTHYTRILYAVGNDKVQELNKWYAHLVTWTTCAHISSTDSEQSQPLVAVRFADSAKMCLK